MRTTSAIAGVTAALFVLQAAGQVSSSNGSSAASAQEQFAKLCAGCLGGAATGTDRGPALLNNRMLRSRPENQIRDLIRNALSHNLMAHETARAIAMKLGNVIVAPVMPFSVNEASADLPGTIGLTGELFAAVNEQVTEQLIKSGFKNVFLMGDHGGGQKELSEIAKKLDGKYSSQGIHVFFCGETCRRQEADVGDRA